MKTVMMKEVLQRNFARGRSITAKPSLTLLELERGFFLGFMFFLFSPLFHFLKGPDINESFSALFYLLFIHCNFFLGLLDLFL